MDIQEKEALTIVGISLRTTNENGQAMKEIPEFWHKFMENNIRDRISGIINHNIYALYTDYVSDHTKPYSMILGYEVSSLDNIPEDLTVKIIPTAKYVKFTAKGDLTKDAMYNSWKEIWNSESVLNRAYTTDVEVYGKKAIDPTNGEADIFISVN
jgi:predicted transcriptional regulator YdeE